MKQNKMLKICFSLALLTMLCLSSFLTTFATGSPVLGTEESPAQAAITKMLQMSEGTTTPTVSFAFSVTKKSVNEKTTTEELAAMPVITNPTISYTAADTGTTAVGLKSVPKETGNLFAGITWPHAGVYVYTITETADTYVTATGETMTYSGASYDMAVYVQNGTNGHYIAAIATTIETADNAGQTVGNKVNLTPGGESGSDYSDLIFTNTFTKVNGGTDPTNPSDSALSISKTVAGGYGDQSKYFPYDLTLTKAAAVAGTPVYKAYVVEAVAGTDTVVTATANAAAIANDAAGNYIEVTAGTAATINLKHGQRLVFLDTPIGTKYVVVERAVTDYTPTAQVTVNGETPIAIDSGENTALSTTERLIGESTNAVDFTNTYKMITPTGITLNNLPFLMMIVLAVGVLLIVAAVKFRKKDSRQES